MFGWIFTAGSKYVIVGPKKNTSPFANSRKGFSPFTASTTPETLAEEQKSKSVLSITDFQLPKQEWGDLKKAFGGGNSLFLSPSSSARRSDGS